VPLEWNITDAYVRNSAGERVIDFRKLNLHVLGYSVPVRAQMSLTELKPHLISIPEQPDAIPYRTSYYTEAWGFCLAHRQLVAMPDGEYEVCIDSSLAEGHLTYGESYHRAWSGPSSTNNCSLRRAHGTLPGRNRGGTSRVLHRKVVSMLSDLRVSMATRINFKFLRQVSIRNGVLPGYSCGHGRDGGTHGQGLRIELLQKVSHYRPCLQGSSKCRVPNESLLFSDDAPPPEDAGMVVFRRCPVISFGDSLRARGRSGPPAPQGRGVGRRQERRSRGGWLSRYPPFVSGFGP
jgi:hypothetical protein